MGNIASLYRRRPITATDLLEVLHEVNHRRFGGAFVVEPEYDGVAVSLNGEGWCYWKQNKSGRRWGGKSPHGPEAIYWTWLIFQNEIAHLLGCRLADEGVEETWEPNPEKFPTIQSWVRKPYCTDEVNNQIEQRELRRCPPQLLHLWA